MGMAFIDVQSGEAEATSGHAFVRGQPVGSVGAQRALSLCPQGDPLLAFLTPHEQLQVGCLLLVDTLLLCSYLVHIPVHNALALSYVYAS